LRSYELTLVFSPGTVQDSEQPAYLEKIVQLITEQGGAISELHHWGRRKLAYPINKANEGYYVLAEFNAGSKCIAVLKESLEFSEDVLRYLIIRTSKL